MSNISSRLRSNPSSSSAGSEKTAVETPKALLVVEKAGAKAALDWKSVAMVMVAMESFMLEDDLMKY